MNKELVKFLNKEVANLGVLYTKLHNFHWFVTGKNFFTLHEKFEEMYDEVTAQFDEVAERMLQLEARPAASLKEFLELATVKEATGGETVEEMVKSTLNDYVLLNDEFAEGIKLAEAAGDDVTVDLLTGMRASLQKHVWMLKAYLN